MESCETKAASTLLASVPSRDEQIRSFLHRNHLKVWIAWRPDELLMLSGYFPFWGASLIVCFEDAQPILFLPQIEPRDHIPPDVWVQEYPWGDLKCSDPYSALVAAIGNELAKAKIDREQVGMNPAAARTSLPIQAAEQIPMPENFAAQLGQVSSIPKPACQADFAALYLQKTPEEVEAIRRANQVANVGLRAFFANLQPSVTEAEVAAAVESAIYRQIGRDGIFHSRGWAMVQSGPNSADAGRFNRSTGRVLQKGDLAVIELATCVNGYWSDLTRTAAVGPAKDDAAELLNIVTDAQQSAIDSIRPGISAGHVDSIARDKIAAHGLASFFPHHTGHHVGFRYHDPGFLIAPGVPNKLETGMIVTIEPGAYVPERGAGARMEDDVLVTESGYEVLSTKNGASK